MYLQPSSNAYTTPAPFARSSVSYAPVTNQIFLTGMPRFGANGLIVEEGTTNLLSAANSLSISSAVSVTVTNGSKYTVSCSTGSITLSGAVTGTVVPGTPVTVTASTTTLTLTPATTATYVQVEAKTFATSWQIGGTARVAETLPLPASVIVASQGSIVIDIDFKSIYLDANNKYLLSTANQTTTTTNRLALLHWSTGKFGFNTYTDATHSSAVSTLTEPSQGKHRFGVRWSASEISLWLDGVKQGAVSNPNLPVSIDSPLYVGSWITGGLQTNSQYSNLHISNIARNDAWMAANGTPGQAIAMDANTTYYAVLKSNLKARSGGNLYQLPQYSALSGDNISSRMSESPKVLRHGSLPTGDGKYDSRTLDIEAYIEGKDQADYFTQTDAFKRYLSRTDQRLYITDTRYINVDGLYKVKTAWLPGFYLVRANLTATLKAYDPFFYDEEDGAAVITIATEATEASPYRFTITNNGNVDVPIVLTITANGNVPSLTLKNTTDGGRLIMYADANFTINKVLAISPLVAGGSVTLDGVNTINNFSGVWLRLLPGDNVFEYVGGPCAISAAFPVGWL